MADKPASVGYLSPTDPAAEEANRIYQEALAKLNQSLDLRKNRMFDPTWLAVAKGFLGPTQTGSFFESLGRVAGGLSEAQEQRIKEQQEEARQRLDVAGAGLELERLKQQQRAIEQYANRRGIPGQVSVGAPSPVPSSPAGGLPAAAPSGGLPATAPSGGSPAPAAGALPTPPGLEGVTGIPVMPPEPGFITGDEYLALNRFNKNVSLPELLKAAQEIDRKRTIEKEAGIVDRATGLFYQFPKGEQVNRQIEGKTYPVDQRTAMLLDMYAASNDPRYWDVAKRVTEGPTRGRPTGERPTEGGAPAEAGRPKSLEELKAEEKEAEALAAARGKTAGEREAAITDKTSQARQIYGITERVNNALKASENYFGIFARTGPFSAVGNLFSQGFQTPSGSFNLPAFENSVRAMLPGIKQSDLDNISNAAADLAQLELLFARSAFAGQGAVSNLERQLGAKVPGTTSNSPDVLRMRMQLLKERAQYDIDVGDAWREYQDKNPGKSFLQFERSTSYRNILRNYEERLGELEKRMPALPTSQRPPARPSPQELGTARQRLDSLLEGR